MSYKVYSKAYTLKKVNRILDNVHGHIELTKVEDEIEKLPIFKRLINISQLGMVNRIFPGAVHNRYSHSLGVMYVCDLMMKSINDKHDKEIFTPCERQILRLAALLHDIGHYPLSHNIEAIYKDWKEYDAIDQAPVEENVESITSCPKELIFGEENPYSTYINKYEGTLNKHYHHEKIGYNIIISNSSIAQCVKDYFVLIKVGNTKYVNPFFAEKKEYTDSEVDDIVKALLSDIANIVIGNYSYESKYHSKHSAMVQLLHSEMDADNIDYLLRDATFSGTTYGVMDFKVLVGCLDVAQIKFEKNPELGTKYIVGIIPKGIGSVEQFLINRYLSYKQVVHSKYVSILESMAYLIAKETIAIKDYTPEKILKYSKASDTEEAFLSFNDNFVLSCFKTRAESRDPAKSILNNLSKNLAFKVIEEVICTDIQEDICRDMMRQKTLYGQFKTDYDQVSKIEYGQLNSKQRTALFSYKFEKFNLTRQIPLEKFKEKVRQDDSLYEKYDFYRLADGIPIIGNKKCYKHRGSKVAINYLPKLIVDSESSFLHNLPELSYIILRKYDITQAV